MKSNELLAWIDIEATGLDPFREDILEVACIFTRQDLSVVGTVNYVINQEPMADMIPIVKEMHSNSGLLKDSIENGISELEFEHKFTELLASILQMNPGYEKFVMAGSGVARYDFTFFQVQFPEIIEKFFSYYTLDIGVVRRALELAGCISIRDDEKDPIRNSLTHRAMSDIEDHLQEWKMYRTILGTLPLIKDWEPNAWR